MWHKAGPAHQRFVIVRFLRRQIEHQQAVHARLRRVFDEPFQADLVNEVEINVEDNRDLRVAGGSAATVARTLGGVVAGFETALRGELVHQAVGQRIAERHAQFQHVHARLVEGQREPARGVQIRIARADIDDETLFALALEPRKTFHDAIHSTEFQVSGFKFQVRKRYSRICQKTDLRPVTRFTALSTSAATRAALTAP